MNFFLTPGMMSFWIIGVWIITAIVHVGFAAAVLADAGMMPHKLRREPILVGGVIWALATLLGGVFVAVVYWLVHHSTLCPSQRTDAPASGPASP
ncbi:MAG TPA: hypothetical protein VK961_20780 [Chthoniobacter sp.]|nr:hypothetical protein [Chthoniobacter sp.]